jgi:hypothetical protein
LVLFTGALPTRPEVSPALLSVRTRIWDAPCAGAVRAITVRFWTAAGGVATCDLMFTAPSELCGTGLIPTEFVTFAPLSASGVRRTEPRLIAWPFTKVLRFATDTACTLRAFTKLILRMFVLKTFRLRMNVLRSLILSKNS